MPKINRDKVEDAEMITERFLMDKSVRYGVLKFLSKSIIWANQLKPENWNLNLDKNGQFIRFNIGHEYCIEIFQDRISVLCLKAVLQKSLQSKKVKIQFKGYLGRKKILSYDLNNVPDCLAKVPDSVGCYIEHDQILECLPLLEKANRSFIEYAILNTRQLPVMRDAHSIGYIDYLLKLGLLNDRTLINDNQEDLRIPEEIPIDEIEYLSEGAKKVITVNGYERNPKARKKCIDHWKAVCIVCGFDFYEMYGEIGNGFIHVHHIIPISEIGEEYEIDPIKDLIPVCPNCHSMIHRTNPPLTIEELKKKIERIKPATNKAYNDHVG